ncbi:hypothetical protein IQ07DRAFT_584608 [Pyrenochaeta sp. DS3sAY3a]|nr:hypothetical protein IQ07DRAFT_584608 [Pyrenochaeta sp. DS3sAY3a]
MLSSARVVVPLRPGSDGDATHVPKQGTKYSEVDPPTLYLEKLAQLWMDARGEARPGVKYILERLPAGYTMWQRPRPLDPTTKDKYLYGHPDLKMFDSPNRFFPHFRYLMDNAGDSMGCPCTVCGGGRRPVKTSSSTLSSSRMSSSNISSSSVSGNISLPQVPRHDHPPTLPTSKGRPKVIGHGLDTTHVDEEGTPDVYRNLIDKLRRDGTLDERIEQPLSPDWLAEQVSIPELLQSLNKKEQWVPRAGEVVLFTRHLPEDDGLLHHGNSDKPGYPQWEAGLVSQTSIDPTYASAEEDHVIYSGVRVEPLPDPNSSDKSFSKQHKYVPLRNTRPFIYWHHLLKHVPKTNWHPTISNALTVASTLSLIGTYRFRGVWPNASLYSHGMYIGFEMLAAGDTVRLLPNPNSGQTACTDVMVIKSIRLKWSGLDRASDNDYDEGPSYTSDVYVYGAAYTSDVTRSNKQWLCDQNDTPPKSAAGYGHWYPLHPPSKELTLPFTRILGRLHERDAVESLASESLASPGKYLDMGREDLATARTYSREHDQRIRDQSSSWYWGDHRADALNLQTINGLDVANFDQQRDIKAWRRTNKRIEGLSVGANNLQTFLAPDLSSLPIRNQQPLDSSSNNRDKRVIDISDGEEEEFRKATKIIEDGPTMKKKAKVTIVID